MSSNLFPLHSSVARLYYVQLLSDNSAEIAGSSTRGVLPCGVKTRSGSQLFCPCSWPPLHARQKNQPQHNSSNSPNRIVLSLQDAITSTFDAKELKEGTAWIAHGPDFFFAIEALYKTSAIH